MWHVSSRSGVATLRTAIHLLLTCYYFLTTRSALTAHTHGNHPERKWAENCDLVPSLTETTSSEITRYFIRRSILARLGIVELCAKILQIMRNDFKDYAP